MLLRKILLALTAAVALLVGALVVRTLGTPPAHLRVSAASLPAVTTPVPALPFVRCGVRGTHCLTPSNTPTVSTALVFDYGIYNDILRQEHRDHVAYVWGASRPEPLGGRAQHDRYVAWAQGCLPGHCAPGTPPGFPWLRKYHPNWILWKTDKGGRPVAPAGYKGDKGAILDFTNPAVQAYWVKHFIAPAIREGFDGIGWDNPVLWDVFSAVGHFSTKHKFIRQYSGTLQDPRYAVSQMRALGQLLKRTRAIDPKATFSFSMPVDCLYTSMANFHLPLRYVQTYVDEEGYSFWGNSKTFIPSTPGPYCGNRWLAKTQFYIQIQKQGKHVVLINEQPFEVRPYITDTDPTARVAMEWALANYFLIKGRHTYFWFGGFQQYGHPILEQREEQVDLGYPFGQMHPRNGVYVRWYSKGMTLVNPNPKIAFTAHLTPGRYKNLYGQNVNDVTMQPHTGLVLIRKNA